MKRLPFFILLTALGMGIFAQETHTVQANQTLYSIARLYGVTVDQLKAWNNLTAQQIRSGQVLVVKPAPANANVNPGLNPFLYTVRTGDSLSAISMKFNIAVEELKRLNALSDDALQNGQKLMIRKPMGISLYTVQNGDSLGLISARFDISQSDLKAINQLGSENLYPGQVLRVFKPKDVPLTHEVLPTDTLNGVAALYNLSPAEIQRINNLSGSRLTTGQVLRLRSYASASTPAVFQNAPLEKKPAGSVAPVAFPSDPALVSNPVYYEVQPGDTLLKICRTQNVSYQNLLTWNSLDKDSVIKKGQKLVVGTKTALAAQEIIPASIKTSPLPQAKGPVDFPDDPPVSSTLPQTQPSATPVKLQNSSPAVTPSNSGSSVPPAASPAQGNLPDYADTDREKLHWDKYVIMDPSIPVFEWNNDYYYWTHPGELSQPNKGYYENDWPSPLEAYRKAKILQNKFNAMIAQKPRLSHILDGYTVVLDPGHGGLDPGTIVKVSDGNGKDLYITEDEYVYDIALRMYALLKRHGARVELTILAPNHLIRDTEPANHTLINEKNEVYNDLVMNQADDADSWPQGTQKGLDKRVEVVNKFLQGTSQGKRIFISLHADNNPFAPVGTGLYTLLTKEGTKDGPSVNLADQMVRFMGKNAYTRPANLAVLRGNEADYKMLVEVHNVAFEDQSWSMRFGNARQLDAQKMVRGLLEYFEK